MRLYIIGSFLFLLLFLIGLQTAARAQKLDAGSGEATVGGQVTIEGKPAAGVVVALQKNQGGQWAYFADRTDAQGKFRIAGLPPGSYSIISHSYAFVLANPIHTRKAIVVEAGETIDDVSIDLVRGGVVTGRVVYGDGRPVVGASVTLESPPDANQAPPRLGSEPILAMTGVTDDRGVYRRFGVPPGRYLVMVDVHFDGGKVGYNVYYPNTIDRSKAKVVEVAAGAEKTDINISLTPSENFYSAFGRLIDAATEKPIPDVYIDCQRLDYDYRKMYTVFNDFVRTTDSDGKFRLNGLSSGKYRINISSRDKKDFDWYSDDQTIDVSNEDVSGIELMAHRGGSIGGVVTIEGANSPNSSEDFANRYVSANSLDPGLGHSAQINPDGQFIITGLRSGEFQLYSRWQSDSGKSLSMERVEVGGQPLLGRIELKDQQNISDVHIVMTYGDGVVRGQVTFQNGAPQENTCFQVSTVRNGECANCRHSFSSVVSAGGQYKLAGLPSGEYELNLSSSPCVQGNYSKIAPVKQTISVASGFEARADFFVDVNNRNSN